MSRRSSRKRQKQTEAKSKAEERSKKQPEETRLPKDISRQNVILRPGACLARLNGRMRGF